MRKTTVEVGGMACGMCEAHINDCIRSNFSVKRVESSRKRGTTVIISEAELDAEAIRRAVSELGYTVGEIHSEEHKKSSLFKRG